MRRMTERDVSWHCKALGLQYSISRAGDGAVRYTITDGEFSYVTLGAREAVAFLLGYEAAIRFGCNAQATREMFLRSHAVDAEPVEW